MNDYQQAKEVSSSLKLNKQVVITAKDIPTFRRYLSLVAMKSNRKFVTKIINKQVLVLRIK